MSGTELNNRGRKYVPYLPGLQAVCEANYARLLRLLPDCDTTDLTYTFKVKGNGAYRITILDSSRYTSTIHFEQIGKSVPAYLRPAMDVRLYHDAQMAEVLSSQRVGAIKASYQYPNIKMHQPNEKEMINHFLSEWLGFCLAQKSTNKASSV